MQKVKLMVEGKPNKTNQTKYDNAKTNYQKVETNYQQVAKQHANNERIKAEKKREVKRFYENGKLFGLTKKERQEQYQKVVSPDSQGKIRRRETDINKIQSMLTMLGRVVKNGFIADYVLTDSWFFCYALLEKLRQLKKGAIKLVSMVKINNQIFTDYRGNKMSVAKMPEQFRKKIVRCKKLKAQYLKINCFYEDIRVNLFFVKMGKATTWHLLATTDLEINFIKLMEVYQIRWSIEVFFKESKQYLNLENCKSSCFDGHIADITISMLQYIMLSYFKRLNYLQSFGELFKNMSKEFVELDLARKLLDLLWILVELLCDKAGFDLILFQKEVLNDDLILTQLRDLLPQSVVQKAA